MPQNTWFNPKSEGLSLLLTNNQFVTFYVSERSIKQTDDIFKSNFWPVLVTKFMNSIKLEAVSGLILKKE